MTIRKALVIFAAVLGTVLFFGAARADAQRATLNWEGTIDDRANLIIRGRSVRVQTISGRPNRNGRSDWDGNFGWRNRDSGRARVDKEEGRGSVRIIQQPSRYNNFTTIIRIEDRKGGPDRYRIRVTWD